MKKTLSLLLVFLLLLASLPVFAATDYMGSQGGYTFTINLLPDPSHSPLTILDYSGPGGEVEIPEEFYVSDLGQSFTVRRIADHAFAGKNITRLTLPLNLVNIERRAFADNELFYISLPGSLSYIGEEAFYNNRLLNIDFWEPNHSGPYTIERAAFGSNRLSSTTLPEGLSPIHEDIFEGNIYELTLYGSSASQAKSLANSYGYKYDAIPQGFVSDENFTYFYDVRGHRHRGWLDIAEGRTYFDEEIGFQLFDTLRTIGGNKYYFDEDGLMQTDYFLKQGQVARIAGGDRYETSVEASKANFKSADSVILALGSNFPDALAGASLAGRKSPILLTSKNGLPPQVLLEIRRLKAKKIYILGGPGAVPAGLDPALEQQGFQVKRLAGDDRYETAAAIAREVSRPGNDQAIMVSGSSFPDALSIGPVAARESSPIILTRKNEIPAASLQALSDIGAKKITLVGGPGVISQAVENQLKNLGYETFRIAGEDRYETSLKIAQNYWYFNQTPGINEVIVAAGNGDKFPDALVASYMANLRSAPILLSNQNFIPAASLSYIAKKTHPDLHLRKTGVHIMGGTAAISQGVENTIKNVLK